MYGERQLDGADERCAWIESDGQRYELVGAGGWEFGDLTLTVQDRLGNVIAAIGDPITVVGQVYPLLGTGCTESAIVVDELTPGP